MIVNSHYLKFFANPMNSLHLAYDEAFIKKKLLTFESVQRHAINDDFFTKSAVLFTIIPNDDMPYKLLIIKRANTGRKHRGEMSFPGGKYDSTLDYSLKETALRECEEEIGVPSEKIQVLGCLNDFPTMTQYIITPFVGVIDDQQELIMETMEVQDIIKVPITFFMEKKNFKEKRMKIEGRPFSVYYFNYHSGHKKYVIWGATAYMISNFIETVYNYKISQLGLKRLNVEDIKPIKNYLATKEKINHHLKRNDSTQGGT